jgi:GntR family transcriptional regulator
MKRSPLEGLAPLRWLRVALFWDGVAALDTSANFVASFAHVVYTTYQVYHFMMRLTIGVWVAELGHHHTILYADHDTRRRFMDATEPTDDALGTSFGPSMAPRYYRLKQILRNRVTSGEWQPGAIIPSERELSETYDVSRMTARQAVTELVNEGIFYREQGRGTFVTRPVNGKIRLPLHRLTGFTEDILARGQRPSTKIITARIVEAEAEVADRMQIAVGEPIVLLQRLRLADDHPLAIETSQLHFKGCERLLDDDVEHQSLYKLLETKYHLALVSADQELEAGIVSPEEAELLQLAPGSAVLYIRRSTYNDRNDVIEYAVSVYCGSQYIFYTHLKRQ